MKKIVSILAIVMLSGLFLYANGQKEDTTSSGPQPLSIWTVAASEVPIVPEDVKNWQMIEEKTNVDLDWQIVQVEGKDQQFNLMMAAGDVPDIVSYYEGKGGFTTIGRFGEEGAFAPLEDLITEYAPNLKRIILDDPEIRETITAQDGHIYVVPMMAAIKASRGWFIRYDWLKKLGLDVPVTTDDLYNVLKAFKTEDPNGNGKADEVPLVFRRRGDDAFYNLGALAYAFDADMDFVDRNGKVVFGPAEPQYKEYLTYIHKLYTEGLIDQEILTRQGNPRNELLSMNVAGGLHDWFASTSGLNDTLSGDIPGFDLRHMAPPMGTISKPFTKIQMSTVRQDGGWALSAKNADLVASIKLFDFLYSDEGQILSNFGVEGDTYNMVNGKPVYTDKITNNPEGMGMHESLAKNGMQWKVGMIQHIDYEAQFANAIAFAARADYQDKYIVDKFPVLSFTAEENDTVVDLYGQIRTYTLENTAKFMVGARPLNEIDAFVKELNDMGLAKVTSLYQTAYNRKY
ncbi:MAG: extracellular solute-binding protein [Spirochaetaceae bacterium]|nr:extracellular solute-binding protein [Spirochaetaceae bacterium]